jgi:uncharacterized membrane protein YgdD (TMEM256/DUF423 family)
MTAHHRALLDPRVISETQSMPWNSVAAAFGASGVLLAAFGAHGLARHTDAAGMRWWAIGVALQLFTAPVLLGLVALPKTRTRELAGRFLALGILLFSGTLYAMTLGAPRWLGAITPLGGLLLCAGWILVGTVKRPAQSSDLDGPG